MPYQMASNANIDQDKPFKCTHLDVIYHDTLTLIGYRRCWFKVITVITDGLLVHVHNNYRKNNSPNIGKLHRKMLHFLSSIY